MDLKNVKEELVYFLKILFILSCEFAVTLIAFGLYSRYLIGVEIDDQQIFFMLIFYVYVRMIAPEIVTVVYDIVEEDTREEGKVNKKKE